MLLSENSHFHGSAVGSVGFFVLRQNDLERIFLDYGIDGGFTLCQSTQLLSESQ
jgi:hypothetical protein